MLASRGEGWDKGNNTQNNTQGEWGAPLNSESWKPVDCVAIMKSYWETTLPLHPFTCTWQTTDARWDFEALLKNMWYMSMMWWCFMCVILVTVRQGEQSFIMTPAFKWHQIFQSYCNDLQNNVELCICVCVCVNCEQYPWEGDGEYNTWETRDNLFTELLCLHESQVKHCGRSLHCRRAI